VKRLPPAVVTAIVLVAGFAICAMQFPNIASTRVVANLLTDNAFLGIVATGMTFVIISGGIDLSVGSVIGFTTVFVALAIERMGIPPSSPSWSSARLSGPRWAASSTSSTCRLSS
jgi:ribose/xylose/arabinose/galactoside ABC-type transport system permease subunit